MSTMKRLMLLCILISSHNFAYSDDTLEGDSAAPFDAQLGRGEALLNEHCSECHDHEFFVNSVSNRVGEPVSYLFEEILVTMPLTAPGLLSEREYEDILAYILKISGNNEVDFVMTYASGAMDSLLIQDPRQTALIE